jgi:phage shock protein A
MVALVVATQRRLRRQMQRAVCPKIRQELQQALAHQSVHCRQLQQQLLHLEQQVQAIQAKREVLTARISTAEARKAICDLRQHITDGTLPAVLSDTEELVHRLEAEVELWEHHLGESLPCVYQR